MALNRALLNSAPVLFFILIFVSLLTACQLQWLSSEHSQVNLSPPEQQVGVSATPSTIKAPFKDVTEESGIDARHRGIWLSYATDPYPNGYLAAGSAWGDMNNDGWVDLFVAGNLEPNTLYMNSQDGTFQRSTATEMVSLPNIPSGGAVWADYDNDGWQDLYVLNLGANALFRNVKGEQFIDATEMAGVGNIGKSKSAAWGDYDNDGYLDLFVTNWACHPECSPLDHALSQDVLYHNNRDGTFSDVSSLLAYDRLLGAGFATSFVDFDNDRDLDIYVVNDKVTYAIGNVLWRNDGPGCDGWCWTDVATENGSNEVVHGMGLASGDYDNDGDLDLYFSNMVSDMVLLGNRGDGSFINQTKESGVGYNTGRTVGWGTAFFDYDNDGWLDLYLATTAISDIYGKTGMMFDFPDILYHNRAGKTFQPVDALLDHGPIKEASVGSSIADYDNDGDVDLLVGHWNQGFRLYQNQMQDSGKHHWLKVFLDAGGSSEVNHPNRNAIGARVYVYTNDGHVQMQEVKSGSSAGTGNDIRLHFGLSNAQVQQVSILWPNGAKTTYTDVPTNRIWKALLPPN